MSQVSKTEASTGHPLVAYNRYYYEHYQHDSGVPYAHNEHWQGIFEPVAQAIVRHFRPDTVLDAGCAVGLLVQALRDLDVDASGIDVSEFAVTESPEAVRPHLRQGSLAEPIEGRYDLVCCIETVEHMPAAEAEQAIANICAVTDRVLFSSSPDDFGEPSHLTVRPTSHWAGLFAENGFVRDPTVNADFVAHWAAVFERADVSTPELVRRYESLYGRSLEEVEQVRREILDLDRRLEHLTELTGGLDGQGLEQERQHAANLERELLAVREQVLSMRDEIIGLEGRLAESEGIAEFHREETARYEEFVRQYEAILASSSWRLVRGAAKPYDWLRSRLAGED